MAKEEKKIEEEKIEEPTEKIMTVKELPAQELREAISEDGKTLFKFELENETLTEIRNDVRKLTEYMMK